MIPDEMLQLDAAGSQEAQQQAAITFASSSSASSSWTNFILIQSLSNRESATTYLAMSSQAKHVVIKLFRDPGFVAAAFDEYLISKDLDHPNINGISSCGSGPSGEIVLVQSYASKGDLFEALRHGITWQQAESYFSNLIDGLEYLHSRGIVHRDVKPENIVIDEHDVAKLCDFGLAGYHGAPTRRFHGSLPYVSPESFFTDVGDVQHDVWSAGVVLFVIMTGKFPWEAAVMSDPSYSRCMQQDFNHGPWATLPADALAFFRRVFVARDQRCNASGLREGLGLLRARQGRGAGRPSGSSQSSATAMTVASGLVSFAVESKE